MLPIQLIFSLVSLIGGLLVMLDRLLESITGVTSAGYIRKLLKKNIKDINESLIELKNIDDTVDTATNILNDSHDLHLIDLATNLIFQFNK